MCVEFDVMELSIFLPFSNCSICSVENEVLFLCNFRLSLSLNWESSSADELWSELPSEVASFIPSLAKSLKLTETKDVKHMKHLQIREIFWIPQGTEVVGNEFIKA